MYRKLFILLLVFNSSCSNQEEMKTETDFFDIKGFFEAEVKRLTNKKSTVKGAKTQGK